MYLKKQQQNKAKTKEEEKKEKKIREERKTERKKKGYLVGFAPGTIGSARLHFTTTCTPQRMKKSIDSQGLAFSIELQIRLQLDLASQCYFTVVPFSPR